MPAGKSGCWAENGLEDILSKGSRGGLSWSEVIKGIRGGTSQVRAGNNPAHHFASYKNAVVVRRSTPLLLHGFARTMWL
ncbi:hypothetical protein V6N12_022735 [Hibiscus sabdariffa]|uniref:Uncharacterized protein n=1 Tax=Hibiscus sabdariffa TaxID=183260 RepID=A0ABR2FVJ2_9ROSI